MTHDKERKIMKLKYLTNTRSPRRTEYDDYNNVKKIGPESKEKY